MREHFKNRRVPCGAVKCAKTHKCANAHILCKHFAHKCANNHICANISPTNVQTTTFVQTFRPQMCKSVKKKKKNKKKQKIHQPQMCKHHAYKIVTHDRVHCH